MKNLRVAVYLGEGADLSIAEAFPSGIFLNASTLMQTDWELSCSILIMPGGRDRPYHTALKGPGNQKIRAFVENGGCYLGICAGAYYGCAEVEFDRGCELEVCEKRELSFFPGKAVGPAFGNGSFDYTSYRGARAAKLLSAKDNTSFLAYYNGGCTFRGKGLSDCEILAVFADLPSRPPAIIRCKIGQGFAILSGVHIETDANLLDAKDPFLAPLILKLAASEPVRKSFLLKAGLISRASASEISQLPDSYPILPKARPPIR